MAVDAAIATEVPKLTLVALSGAASLACCDQVPVDDRVNTYTAPEDVLPKGAPTSAVDPARATEEPRSSPGVPSEAVSSACCDQVPADERVNTYAAPVKPFVPSAPMTVVDL